MRIAIKVNLVTFAKPEKAATTHPGLLCALVKMLAARGADVVVGDSPGGLYNAAYVNRVYAATGMRAALRRQQRTHVPRRSAGGTVPLHAVHRVHNGQAGLEILVQIHNHPGKIPPSSSTPHGWAMRTRLSISASLKPTA